MGHRGRGESMHGNARTFAEQVIAIYIMQSLWDECRRVSYCPTNWWAFLFYGSKKSQLFGCFVIVCYSKNSMHCEICVCERDSALFTSILSSGTQTTKVSPF